MAETSTCAKRKYFALWDLIVLSAVVLFVVLGIVRMLLPKETQGLVAVVKVKGEVVSRIELENVAEPYEVTLEGEGGVVLCVSPTGVWFKDSDCPDKLCVNTGKLTYAGQSAVCLPARVSVSLEAGDEGEKPLPDAVAG